MEVGLHFFVQENFNTVVKLSAEVRFCRYPVTLLNILKVYVFNKKIS